MKAEKYCFILAVFAGILCVPVFGEVELPPLEEKPILLGQSNPALAGIRQLYVVILPPDAEPNKDGLVWKNLKAAVEGKINQTGIKVAEAIQHEHILRSLAIPELRIDINMLKLADSQQYVFRIQMSLAKKVHLTKDSSQYIKADLWETEPVMQAVSVQSMPATVTNAVLEQVEAFIHAYLAANPPDKKLPDANNVATGSKEITRPASKPPVAEYKFVASKNSDVFHKADCGSARRINPENLIGYNSADEAIQAGKKPCKRCKP